MGLFASMKPLGKRLPHSYHQSPSFYHGNFPARTILQQRGYWDPAKQLTRPKASIELYSPSLPREYFSLNTSTLKMLLTISKANPGEENMIVRRFISLGKETWLESVNVYDDGAVANHTILTRKIFGSRGYHRSQVRAGAISLHYDKDNNSFVIGLTPSSNPAFRHERGELPSVAVFLKDLLNGIGFSKTINFHSSDRSVSFSFASH